LLKIIGAAKAETGTLRNQFFSQEKIKASRGTKKIVRAAADAVRGESGTKIRERQGSVFVGLSQMGVREPLE